LDRNKFVLVTVEEVKRKVIFEGVVGKEDTFEVVVFVEKKAGGKRGESFGNFDASLVDRLDFDFFGAGNGPIKPGDREAAFEGGMVGSTPQSSFFASVQNNWIKVDFEAFIEERDEATEVKTNLGEGETDSLGVMGVLDGIHQIMDMRTDLWRNLLNGS